MQKIGIYSGTFDPVHEGHLAFAEETIKQQGLEKVFFMVEPRPRRKQGVKAFEHRARMVQLAIADNPKLGSIILDQERFTTADTLPVLIERFRGAELCMLMGDDMVSRLAAWPQVEELLKSVSFIVGLRRLERPELEREIENITRVSARLRYELIQAPLPEISSSNIKQSMKQGKQPAGLPPSVSEYIQSTGLYVAPASASANSS